MFLSYTSSGSGFRKAVELLRFFNRCLVYYESPKQREATKDEFLPVVIQPENEFEPCKELGNDMNNPFKAVKRTVFNQLEIMFYCGKMRSDQRLDRQLYSILAFKSLDDFHQLQNECQAKFKAAPKAEDANLVTSDLTVLEAL